MSKYSWFIDFLLQKGWLLKPLAETQEDYSSAESNRVLALIKATPLNFQAFKLSSNQTLVYSYT